MAKAGIIDRALNFVRDLTEPQLRRLVRVKKYIAKKAAIGAKLRRLKADVERMVKALSLLDRKIRALFGHKEKRGSGRPRSRRAGHRTGPSLQDVLLGVLGKAKRALGLTEITKAILQAGYKTGSTLQNFRISVAHALSRLSSRLRKIGQTYTIAKGKPKRKARTKSKKKSAKKTRTAKPPMPKTAAKPTTKAEAELASVGGA